MRGQDFSPNETSALLDLTASHLHISASDWDNITRSHLVYYPESRRTSESLRRKFNSLCMTKPRSGEICIHLNVERAKAIHNQIMQRTKSNNAEDDDNLNDIIDDDMSNVELDGDSDLNPPCAVIMLCLWLYEFYSHMLSPHHCQL